MDNSVYNMGADAIAHDKKLGCFGPQQLLEEIQKLNILVAQVGGVVNASPVGDDIKKLWNENFVPSWAAYSKPRNLDFYANEPRFQMPENLVEELNELRRFQSRLVTFAAILKSRGVVVAGFEDEKGLPLSTKVLLVAGGGLLLYVLAKEVGKGVVGKVSKVIDGE